MYKYLKLHLLIKSDRIKFLMLWVAHKLRLRHLSLRIDPILACNLSCLMCYFSDGDFRKKNKGKMDPDQIERIAEILFPSALQVVLGCATEPTLYKDYVSIIKIAKEKGVPNVSLTTNGQLITKDKITELIQAGCDEITLSVHGVYKEMYEKFMPGANYEKLQDFLFNLKEEKLRMGSKTPTLRINYTANPENIYELSDFFKVYEKYSISILQVRPVMQIGGVYNSLFINDIDVKAYKDILGALTEESKNYHVSLLANIGDIGYQEKSNKSSILESVYRYISPEILWERDFNWQTEDYYSYCKRIGWSKWLWKNIFNSQVTKEDEDSFLKKYSGRYEVVS